MAQRLAQKTVKTRRSANDQGYWKKRLFHRYYEQDGKKVVVPDWYVRICYAGRRHFFNLETGNEDTASKKARDVFQMLVAEGWEATLSKFKPKPQVGASMTLEEFADLYRKTIRMVEFPPDKPSVERYINCLSFIARRVHVRKLEELTSEKIEKFRADYFAEAQKAGRDENSIKTTINFHLRNAGALFSRQVIQTLQNQGVPLSNPFAGKKLRRVEIRPYSPLKRELLDRLWQDAARLRDGDPEVPERIPVKTGGRKAKRPSGEKAKRWKEPDFRKPHPDSYAILLLELGLGFRRNEADKAEWAWFHTINDRHYIEVRDTPYFKPKPRERRIVPVEPLLYEAIKATRTHVGAWIVPGPAPKRYDSDKKPKNIVYRCDKAHRVLAAWLRQRGIADGKPCHLLRKEFGSYVATSFGLFHAQRMLGHSSPDVTSAYYAGLTELPELKHFRKT